MPSRRSILLLLLVTAAPAWSQETPGTRASPLKDRLLPLLEAHKGKVAVAVKHLDTGEEFLYRSEEPMPTASLIKLAVMVETYRQAQDERLNLGGMVTLRQLDKVPGSGVLTPHFSPGASFSLRDAVRLMMAFSDNTATNLVLDRIGIPATAKTMEQWGYPNTKIHSNVYRRDTSAFPARSELFGLGSTTASEMIRLCEAIYREKILTPAACQDMLAHMKACDDTLKFPRLLPPGTPLAFKTGSVDAARTAAGLILGESGPIALCVLTAENNDQRWTNDNAGDLLCALIAKEVFDYFNSRKARPDPRPAQPQGTP